MTAEIKAKIEQVEAKIISLQSSVDSLSAYASDLKRQFVEAVCNSYGLHIGDVCRILGTQTSGTIVALLYDHRAIPGLSGVRVNLYTGQQYVGADACELERL